MKRRELKLTVIWEEITTPDAAERIAAAFTMLLSSFPSRELPPDQSLDSKY